MRTISDLEQHLIGMGHGGTLNKVRNLYSLYERVASKVLARMKPIEAMRTQALASAVYDDVNNYALPVDYNDLIDLIPQDNRDLWDKAFRNNAGQFDIEKAVREKTLSIEANNGLKYIRINWRSRQGKVLSTVNGITGNGTWSAVGSATGVATDNIFYTSGGGSVVLTHVASGDGIQNTTMNAVDLTKENGVSTAFVQVYFSVVPTSAQLTWGNDLTTKYWTGVAATTQADGTAFKVGWNLIQFVWSAATQTGTNTTTAFDSAKITFAGTNLGKIRVDNIIFNIGRNFDIKYYSKYFFIDKDGITWKSAPVDQSDYVLVDNDSLPHFLYECLKEMAQQMEGTDGAFDITYAEKELATLYPSYKSRYPSQVKKTIASYGSGPNYGPYRAGRFKK